MSDLAGLIAQAGFAPDTPVGLARVTRSGAEEAVAGVWPDGRSVGRADRFYAASLAKQVTGTAAALLVRDGQLDADTPVARYLPGLPGWAGEITARQLAHHVAGLPAAGEIERRLADGDWTMERVLAALSELHELRPRTYAYSNVGYVLLAQIVAEVSGEPFERFVQARLFDPLGLTQIGFAGPRIAGFPQASLLGASRPLTVGDGGLWASAGAFARWLEAQNRDAFGVAAIVEAPDRGSDYGWGIGLRTMRGERSFIHGGEWTGAVAKCVRCPALGLAVVALAAGPPIEALNALVEAALAE